jgi:arginase family enzyme
VAAAITKPSRSDQRNDIASLLLDTHPDQSDDDYTRTMHPKGTPMTKAPATAARDALVGELARKHLFIETLEERKRDCLDFHNVSVWGVQAALEAAYAAGLAAAKQEKE